MNKPEVVAVLRALTRAVETLEPAELEQVLAGKGRLNFVGLESRGSEKNPRSKATTRVRLTTEALQNLTQNLRACETREDALKLLRRDDYLVLKESLEKLARSMGIHVDKSDKRDTIENKIVEFVVGSRLRSEAIQSLNLKAR